MNRICNKYFKDFESLLKDLPATSQRYVVVLTYFDYSTPGSTQLTYKTGTCSKLLITWNSYFIKCAKWWLLLLDREKLPCDTIVGVLSAVLSKVRNTHKICTQCFPILCTLGSKKMSIIFCWHHFRYAANQFMGNSVNNVAAWNFPLCNAVHSNIIAKKPWLKNGWNSN